MLAVTTQLNDQPLLESQIPLDYATPQPDRAGRFHQLDGLRAVAATLVIIHHSFGARVGEELRTAAALRLDVGQWWLGHTLNYFGDLIYSLGASGVELFFVLSGIVLLRPYLRGMRTFNAASYFRRRAQRLWPPYLISLVAAGVLMWVMEQFPNWYYDSLPQSERQFTFWGFFSQIGILNLGWDMYNVAWWSLTVELIFYLVAPLMVPVFASRAMTRLMFIVVMVLSFIGAATLMFTVGEPLRRDRSVLQAIENFGVYLPCFLFGLAIAKYDVPRRIGQALLAAGILYILVATQFEGMNVHAGFGLLYAGLVILAFELGSAWTRFLSSPLMVWLGERSYSLFLIHFTVFAGVNYAVSWFVPGKTATYFLLTRLIGLPGAVLAAMVLFYLVERHFARNLMTDKYFWPRLRRL
jgi:peptidoglycan/LPS O-acetylase OafA/YrhL